MIFELPKEQYAPNDDKGSSRDTEISNLLDVLLTTNRADILNMRAFLGKDKAFAETIGQYLQNVKLVNADFIKEVIRSGGAKTIDTDYISRMDSLDEDDFADIAYLLIENGAQDNAILENITAFCVPEVQIDVVKRLLERQGADEKEILRMALSLSIYDDEYRSDADGSVANRFAELLLEHDMEEELVHRLRNFKSLPDDIVHNLARGEHGSYILSMIHYLDLDYFKTHSRFDFIKGIINSENFDKKNIIYSLWCVVKAIRDEDSENFETKFSEIITLLADKSSVKEILSSFMRIADNFEDEEMYSFGKKTVVGILQQLMDEGYGKDVIKNAIGIPHVFLSNERVLGMLLSGDGKDMFEFMLLRNESSRTACIEYALNILHSNSTSDKPGSFFASLEAVSNGQPDDIGDFVRTDVESPKELDWYKKDAQEREEFFDFSIKEILSLIFDGDKEKIQEIADRFLEKMSVEDKKNMLLDRNRLSVGLKFHTDNIKALSRVLKETGGFIAHNAEGCFVMKEPAPNSLFANFVLNILRVYTKDTTDLETGLAEHLRYIQVCSPVRLDNESCGIATTAFLMLHSRGFDWESTSLESTQVAPRMTLYDAKGPMAGDMYIPVKDGTSARLPSRVGRTDMLLALDSMDVDNANTLFTLLVHGSDKCEACAWHSIGKEFVDEFKALLSEFALDDWLDHQFVINYQDGEKPTDRHFMDFLRELTEFFNADKELFKRLEEARGSQSSSGSVTDPSSYMDSGKIDEYDKLLKQASATLTVRLNELLKKYKRKIYENGFRNPLVDTNPHSPLSRMAGIR